LATLHIKAEHQAGENGAPIHQHRASAALTQLAAMLGAGQSQVFSQDFEQGLMRREGRFDLFAIERELYVRSCSHLRAQYITPSREVQAHYIAGDLGFINTSL